MTPLNRVLLGASVGAVFSLLVHPASRPYLVNLLAGPKIGSIRRLEAQDQSPKPPKTLQEAAHWTLMAAEKMASVHLFTPKELQSLRRVVFEGRRQDPTNAFWTQMAAVVEYRMGHESAARQNWIRGSKLSMWNDYQSDYLSEGAQQLAQMSQASESWQLAYLYHRRSMAAAQLVEKYARRVVGQSDLVSQESLTMRYATVSNGALLRDGARNVDIGQIGAFIVEIAAYPSDLVSRRTPKRLILAENYLFNRLIQIGEPDWATFTQNQFARNEAWQALSTQELADDQARNLGLVALILSVMPGAILAVTLVGLSIWALGALCGKAFPGAGFGWVFPIASALILSLLVYIVTSFLTASVAAFLCCLFLAATPTKERSKRPKELGPTFKFTVGMLATAAGTSLVAYLVWGSTAADALISYLNVPGEYVGNSPLFSGLSVLFFAMVFLATPFWALAQRISTPYVFSQGLKVFGLTLGIAGLVLTVVATPIVIYADHRTAVVMRALLLNEPVYYHLQYGPAS